MGPRGRKVFPAAGTTGRGGASTNVAAIPACPSRSAALVGLPGVLYSPARISVVGRRIAPMDVSRDGRMSFTGPRCRRGRARVPANPSPPTGHRPSANRDARCRAAMRSPCRGLDGAAACATPPATWSSRDEPRWLLAPGRLPTAIGGARSRATRSSKANICCCSPGRAGSMRSARPPGRRRRILARAAARRRLGDLSGRPGRREREREGVSRAQDLLGHDPASEPIWSRARRAIAAAGGPWAVNSFTRFYLALLGPDALRRVSGRAAGDGAAARLVPGEPRTACRPGRGR